MQSVVLLIMCQSVVLETYKGWRSHEDMQEGQQPKKDQSLKKSSKSMVVRNQQPPYHILFREYLTALTKVAVAKTVNKQ